MFCPVSRGREIWVIVDVNGCQTQFCIFGSSLYLPISSFIVIDRADDISTLDCTGRYFALCYETKSLLDLVINFLCVRHDTTENIITGH